MGVLSIKILIRFALKIIQIKSKSLKAKIISKPAKNLRHPV
jgi:hypothetical protein